MLMCIDVKVKKKFQTNTLTTSYSVLPSLEIFLFNTTHRRDFITALFLYTIQFSGKMLKTNKQSPTEGDASLGVDRIFAFLLMLQ